MAERRTGRRPRSPGRPVRIFGDTPPEIEARVIDGYRAMSPADKLARVVSLNRALEALATARIRSLYGPDLSTRELRLRLASLRLPREDMRRIFDWDPVERRHEAHSALNYCSSILATTLLFLLFLFGP